MEPLKREDLIDGQIYHCHDGNGEWMFRAREPLKPGVDGYKEEKDDASRAFTYELLVVSGNEKYEDNKAKNKPSIWIAGRKCREATPEEKTWFEICSRQKKFIPKKTVAFYDLANGYYLNVAGLKDNSDDRLMMNFMEELSFEKFLDDGTPLFKIRNPGADVSNLVKEKIDEKNMKLSIFHVDSKQGLTWLK